MFDNDDVGGSGDITNLAFNVVYVRRVEKEDDLTETELKEASETGLTSVNSIVQVTKNRVFGETSTSYMAYDPRSKRFYNNSSYIATKWQDFLPNGYTDNLGKIYNNELPDIDNDICPF